jgi:D-xylose 1-dehydrogenase (NADP+, D-xylono-1,5-lactone-forming)
MIRFGILGTARIARAFFGQPLKHAEIIAIASREKSKADAFGAEYGIRRCYGRYEALLADQDIQAVYIPLPHHLHCEYVVKAANVKKHVLVEKPAALSVAEIEKTLTICKTKRVYFMEAFMYRFKRIHNRATEILRSGTLGELRYIDFNWCFNIRSLERSAFRLDRKTGGGALYDLGIYGIDFVRYLTGGEPELLKAVVRREAIDGVDMFAHACFKVGHVFATAACGYDRDANYYAVGGELGSIYVPGSLSGRYAENILHVHLLEGDRRYDERFPPENPYVSELDYFARCIEQGEEPLPGATNSLRNIQVLEKIFEHHKSI